MKRVHLVLLALVLALFAPAAARAQEPDESAFLADLTALTAAPHRLSGSESGRAAAGHIEARLRGLGLTEVFPLDMPVWLARTTRCELEVGETKIALSPLRPNVVVLPVTEAEGLRAGLLYAGRGELGDYAERSPEGKIVILDYDVEDAWERAFALGARAVIFLGKGGETTAFQKHADVPVNLPRFYASESETSGVDLRRDHERATLFSEARWEQRLGRNLVARIKGTDPGFARERPEPEAVVVSAAYDSFGVVPERAPGARGAANVAALIEAARRFRERPPKRDVILMFLDNQAHAQQGAREVYDALMMPAELAQQLASQPRAELAEIERLLSLLSSKGLSFEASDATARSLLGWLTEDANFARDDVGKALQAERLRQGRDAARERALDAQSLRWDEVRRALHENALAALVARQRSAEEQQHFRVIADELVARTQGRLGRRRSELVELVQQSQQREALRSALTVTVAGSPQPEWIALHVAYDFGDGGSSFGAVVSDASNDAFPWRQPKPDGDAPGYYGRVLRALGEAAERASLPHLSKVTLGEPSAGLAFVPGRFVSSASVAGTYGIYNLALMTRHDARERDGQPGDTLAALDWKKVRTLALEGTELVAAAASSKDLSLPRVFKNYAKSKYPSYAGGQSSGDYAGLKVSGSLKENRPATGAVVALWPGNVTWVANAWSSRQAAGRMPAYEPTLLEAVDARGRFRIVGVREDMFTEVMAFGALFDERGAVRAVSTREQQAQKIASSLRFNLIFANGYGFTTYRTYESAPDRLKLLKASTDAEFRADRAAWGVLENHGFAYVSDQIQDYRLKLFQPMGPVLLGDFDARTPFGAGVKPAELEPGLPLAERSASDLFRLNERRLSELRKRGVTSADLELLHARARRAEERARTERDLGARQASLLSSAALSHRVYAPLRAAMDDLVHAVVVLLLLAIPFAFALERLTFCSTTVYGRIGGFTFWFLVTFALLYFLHPGFAIAATPTIILLAFAIVLLSTLVIAIVVRKFKTELTAMQGQGGGAHDLEVSRAGTMLAAVGMGMSTMRRRPTRTILTAVTVVMLTFTILCFASFSRTVGVRSIYEGPPAEGARSGILLRKLDYSAMLPGVLDLVRGQEGKGGLLAPQYWLTREGGPSRGLSVVSQTGRALQSDAILGLSLEELERSPALATALGTSVDGARQALGSGAVFLPAVMQQVLGIGPGDEILLDGHRVKVGGILDGARLQRLKHLDGQSILPVDFQDVSSLAAGGAQRDSRAMENELLVADEVDRDFVHLSADQVVVASNDLVRALGGKLHVATLYPGEGVDVPERARRLAEVVVMPVWVSGPAGVERLLMTVLTEVSGGLSLFIPLLLGGLIIFGTLLGSISDREKEIYTFSALGLSPGHVGVLFFAEAAVYAVVGGMGGQLLAELVGVVASRLARAGYIEPPSINYSSTNALFAIFIVMATVLVSAVYPALKASKSANPGLARTWKLPPAKGDLLEVEFPFTVSAHDITGVVSFLAENFRRHDDAGLGDFAASNVGIRRAEGRLELYGDFALSPFDLGVTQHMKLTAVPSEIPGVDEVAIEITRTSGAQADWYRANRVFIRGLRRQFLVWRTLSAEAIEGYRLETLQALGESGKEAA